MGKRERVEYPRWFNPTAPAPRSATRYCAWCKKDKPRMKGMQLPAGWRCDDCDPMD